ncbi:FkbM family methyltransferase [Haloarchaeobius sp. HRN-SO-5]|uniref:FkbM family methyltransferase n=1 Tax=Haloarchaeobius sp. HRN-SO-5 TaxID=3446118 RepID=UPI003EBA242D
MGITRNAFRILQTDGGVELLRRGFRRSIEPLDPVYQRVKPEYGTYTAGGSSATFDMSLRSLEMHDFVDDMRSEVDIIERILTDIESDDVFYDIGSNAGVYSCLVGTALDSGQVVSFEPHSGIFDVLESNIEKNDVPATLYNVALSNRDGEATMVVRGQTGHQLASGEDDGTIQIETKRGDSLVDSDGLAPPDVCKIDVEGAEYLVIEGLEETLARSDCRVIYCEVHPEKIDTIGGSAEAVESLLRNLGFVVEYLGERRSNYFVRATRST